MSEGTKFTYVLCNPNTSQYEVLANVMNALAMAGAPVLKPGEDPFDDNNNQDLRKAFGDETAVAKVTVELIGGLVKKEHVQ